MDIGNRIDRDIREMHVRDLTDLLTVQVLAKTRQVLTPSVFLNVRDLIVRALGDKIRSNKT